MGLFVVKKKLSFFSLFYKQMKILKILAGEFFFAFSMSLFLLSTRAYTLLFDSFSLPPPSVKFSFLEIDVIGLHIYGLLESW